MVLSKRERLIAIVTMAVIMIFVFDRYLWTPVMEARRDVILERQNLITEMQRAERIFKQRNRVKDDWNEMKNGGLYSDASATESGVLNAIGSWAQDSGLTLSSIKPEHEKGEGEMKEIIFNLACSGNMNSVSQFLWQVEESTLPLKIMEFQLGSREEDGREMSLQLKLSALYIVGGIEQVISDSQVLKGEE